MLHNFVISLPIGSHAHFKKHPKRIYIYFIKINN
jgi:hypothetical protein